MAAVSKNDHGGSSVQEPLSVEVFPIDDDVGDEEPLKLDGPSFAEPEAEFLKKNGIQIAFSAEALYQAHMTSIPAAELRARPLVKGYTIDAPHAHELDDAIWVERTVKGFKALVTIADVAAILPMDSQADIEARNRAASIYLKKFFLPMLPAEIRAMGTLDPGVPRLAITIEMGFDRGGRLLNVKPFESKIVSTAAFSYEEAERIRNSPREPLYLNLYDAHELARLLLRNRQNRGCLATFDLDKNLVLSEEGQRIILPASQRFATDLIVRELMIAANEAVARHMAACKCPVIFRCHEVYDEMERGDEGDNGPGDMDQQIKRFAELSQRADYSFKNRGHRGLRLEHYTHFTSPLRRYPDLINHRILKASLRGDATQIGKSAEGGEGLASHLSEYPGRAADFILTIPTGQTIRRRVTDAATMYETLKSIEGRLFESHIRAIVRYNKEWIDVLLDVAAEKELSAGSVAQLFNAAAENEKIKEFVIKYLEKYDEKTAYSAIFYCLLGYGLWSDPAYILPNTSGYRSPDGSREHGRRALTSINGVPMTTRELGVASKVNIAQHKAAYLFLRDYILRALVPYSEADTSEWKEQETKDVQETQIIVTDSNSDRDQSPTCLDMILFYVKKRGLEEPSFTVTEKREKGFFQAVGRLKFGDGLIESSGSGKFSKKEALELCQKDMLQKLREAIKGIKRG